MAVLEILTSVYVCSGVPVWLHYVPGTVFRTDSEPFKVCALAFLCSNSVEPYLCYFDSYLLYVVHPSHLFQLYMSVFSLQLDFVMGVAVLHAEVHDIHCELDEAREAFCITRRSYHLGSGK